MVSTKSADLGIVFVAPQSNTDARVPTAEELSKMADLLWKTGSSDPTYPVGLLERPAYDSPNIPYVIRVGHLRAYVAGHPILADRDLFSPMKQIRIPALLDTVSTISRYDYLYLLVCQVEVGIVEDNTIEFVFNWLDQNNVVNTVTKENTQRRRTFVGYVLKRSNPINDLNTVDFLPGTRDRIPYDPSRSLTGVNVSGDQGEYTLYFPWADQIAAGLGYSNAHNLKVVPGSIQLLPVLRVWRAQNYLQHGYRWGHNGENQNIEAKHMLTPIYRYVGVGWDDWDGRATETFNRLLLGQEMNSQSAYDRHVQNFVAGSITRNAQAPGVSAASPNGSNMLANGSRITYSNMRVLQTHFCQRLQCDDDGNGFARAVIQFGLLVPLATRWGPANTFKIFKTSGEEITRQGSFLSGPDTTASFAWVAKDNSTVEPGDLVIVQTGISYHPGCGFAISGLVEKVWINNVQLNPLNIREASLGEDINEYVEPAGGNLHIVVMDRSRMALQYIYRKYTITTDSNGVMTIPLGATGAIAFIEGVPGRIDSPVASVGLNPSQTYNVLLYYAPTAVDNWQFQFISHRYSGTKNVNLFANTGARIISTPAVVISNQGGGNEGIYGDPDMRSIPTLWHMPYNTQGLLTQLGGYLIREGDGFGEYGNYRHLDPTELSLVFIVDSGKIPFRQNMRLTLVNSSDPLSFPRRGFENRQMLADGNYSLSVLLRRQFQGRGYAALIFMVVENNGVQPELLVVTAPVAGFGNDFTKTILIDTASECSFDTFPLY
ncbi:MAG: hypothetical protein DDT26_00818 [Dehalococcoidia bacterium]|nr:hypothetical protein [Chloroflexota bacterium]